MKVKANYLTLINTITCSGLLVLFCLMLGKSEDSLLLIISGVCFVLSMLSAIITHLEQKHEVGLINQIGIEDRIFTKFNNLLDEYFKYINRSTKSIEAHASKSLSSVRNNLFSSIDKVSEEVNHISDLRNLDPKDLNECIDKVIVEMVELNKVMLSSVEEMQKEDLISQYILQINLANERFSNVCKELINTIVDCHNSENIENFDLSHIEAQIDRSIVKIGKFNRFLDDGNSNNKSELDLF